MYFEPTTTRIQNPFFEEAVKKYVSRANFWRLVGCICLLLTMVFVGVCIWIFQRGDPQEKIRAENEAKLTGDLLELQHQQDEGNKQDAERESHSQYIKEATVLANRLGQLSATADALKQQKDSTQVKKVRAYLTVAERALKAIESDSSGNEKSQPELVLDFSIWGGSKSTRFPQKSLAILREQMRLHAVDFEKLKSEVTTLGVRLNDLEKAQYAPDSDAAKGLDPFLTQISEIRRLAAVSVAIKQAESNAQQETERLIEDQPAGNFLRQSRKDSIARLESELKDIREERQKILFMSWIPGLTIRVGSVLILLFLTQIFVATYRYTIGLSAFYLARGDAVAMLQSAPDSDVRYKVDEFGSLADKLSPTLSIDDVKAPIDQIGGLLTPWVSKVK